MSESEYKDPEWENSLELKKALKLVLKYEIHCLLRRLSETGEESVVITASAAEGSASHLCSKKGEDFLQIESLDVVKHNFLSYCKVASEPSLNKKSSLENFMSQSQAGLKEQFEVSPKEQQSSEEITIIEPVSIKSEPVDIDLDIDLQASELTECPQPQEQKTIPSVGRESSQAHRGGGCQQAVSRQSSYTSNHIDQPFTVGLTNTGDTLISLPVRNFDVVVDKDQQKSRFGEMESRSAGVRRFRSSIERRSFRMTTQNTEEFACQKEFIESVNPNDSTGFLSKQQVYLEGAWSGREDSNSHLKSEVDDVVSVDTTDGLSLSEHERPSADSREFSKSFPIQHSDATAPQTVFNLQADLCVAGFANVNNNLNNLEALQSLSQRTFSSNNVILRNEAIPTGLSFNAPGTSINRPTLNRHSGRSRVDCSKVTPGRYLCPYCPVKDFRDRRTLQRHIRKHTGEKPFHCTICGRGLGDSRSLFEHVQLHTGNLPYKCKLCGKAFRHHNTFNAHKKKHFT